MPYVARDKSGAIIAVFKDENGCAQESVSPYDRELQSFLGQDGPAEQARKRAVDRMKLQQALKQSDAEFVRVLDDLVRVLLDKKLILFTDLPIEAQRKLMGRQRFRGDARELQDREGEAPAAKRVAAAG
ncbi:MAG: hypothetical protein R3322_06245 [Kiloniellales bacterium]|jgi:hypothetical protein|nr:hypothetical protein [Kiloniellales bacterium]